MPPASNILNGIADVDNENLHVKVCRTEVSMKRILGFRVKKLLGLGMVLCLLLALTACGKEENKENNGLTEVQ